MWSHGASGLRWPRSTSFGFLEFEITRKAERPNPPSGISLSLSGPCLLETRRNSRSVAILHLGLEDWAHNSSGYPSESSSRHPFGLLLQHFLGPRRVRFGGERKD